MADSLEDIAVAASARTRSRATDVVLKIIRRVVVDLKVRCILTAT